MNQRNSIPFYDSLRALLSVVLIMGLGVAQADGKAVAQSDKNLRILELFTSHGCSSCPPADRLLGELLAEDEKLLALEFHVDYWNSLVHGSAGNFVDPFSKPSYSKRQRDYSATKLAGRPGVYTPQAIINGAIATVGSNRRHISKALKKKMPARFDIRLEPVADDASLLRVRVSGTTQNLRDYKGVDVQLARYIDSSVTHITGGENKNLKLENHHVVFDVKRLGQISEGADMVYNIAAPKAGEGCVVLVQENARTPIYAAVECP